MKQAPTTLRLPERGDTETFEEYSRKVRAWIRGDDVVTKTDLRGWTGSFPFHLNRD